MVAVGADLRPFHLAADRSTNRIGGCSAGEIRAFFGFVFTALALTFFAVGVDVAGYSLTALAFGLAALNASTGLCPGCKAYLLIRRLQSA